MSERNLAGRLDKATEDRRLLDHPFYQAWAAGELTLEDLQTYSGQYWRQVEAFPSYLINAASRVEDEVAKKTLMANLSDEVDDDHAGLWLQFAGSVGAAEQTVRASVVEPETAECVAAFSDGTATASVPFALGMLYGYESQTPAVAETKICGLKEHYGIDGPGLDYFALHGELDVTHAAELAEAVDRMIEADEDLAQAEAGARAGAEAIWRLLDGVERIRTAA
ncbi:MAG: iron-containing redox enzyme family protein [Actinomycetota bacterium]